MISIKNKKTVFIIILAVAILSFILSELTFYFLSGDINIIFAHLLYFPIIIAAVKYPRQAVVMSVISGILYLVVSAYFFLPDTLQIIPAMTQFYVFVSITVIISSLSMKMRMNEPCRMFMETMPESNQSGRFSLWKNEKDCASFLSRLGKGTNIRGEEISCAPKDGTQKVFLLFSSSLQNVNVRW